MSLSLAISRGALDIAHGFYTRAGNWFGRLFDRIVDRLNIALAGFELTELVGITESSRLAVENLWQGNISPFEIPIAEPPYMGSVNGGEFDRYQIKIINTTIIDPNVKPVKTAFYLEFPEIPDKISIEEYIRRFWDDFRDKGYSSPDVDFIPYVPGKFIPVYIVRRS